MAAPTPQAGAAGPPPVRPKRLTGPQKAARSAGTGNSSGGTAPATAKKKTGSKQAADGSKRKVDTSWKAKVTVCLNNSHYPVLREAVKDLGFTLARDTDQTAFLIWYNSCPPRDAIGKLKDYQRLNHFPATSEISRKDSLARNLTRLAKAYPSEYAFFPRSWILPAELVAFKRHAETWRSKGRPKTFIYKPTNSAQGKGIVLTRNPDEVPDDETLLIQEYLARPLLIDGFKFDLRLYVLVTSCDPLRVFLYRDGLVRLSTEPYKAPTESNLDKLYMHLTNYSVNKTSEGFESSDDVGEGSKRSLVWLMEHLAAAGKDTDALWRRMADVVIKTLIVALPQNVHEYRVARKRNDRNHMGEAETPSSCFAIYGFDIFLNKKLEPYVIEVNRSPSLACDSPLDHNIKYGVITHALRLLKLRPSEKVKIQTRERLESQSRLFGAASESVHARKVARASSAGPGGPGPAGSAATAPTAGSPARGSMFRSKSFSSGTSGSVTAAVATEAKELPAEALRKQLKADATRREAEVARRAYEKKHQGQYVRIYPVDDSETEREELFKRLIDESTRQYFAQAGTGSSVPRGSLPREASSSSFKHESSSSSLGSTAGKSSAGDLPAPKSLSGDGRVSPGGGLLTKQDPIPPIPTADSSARPAETKRRSSAARVAETRSTGPGSAAVGAGPIVPAVPLTG